MIPFIQYVQNRQIHRDKKYSSSCLGLGGIGGNGEWLLMGTGVLEGDDENILKLIVVMAANSEYTTTIELCTL